MEKPNKKNEAPSVQGEQTKPRVAPEPDPGPTETTDESGENLLAEYEKKIQSAQSEALYLRAEFENFKKRVQKEKEQSVRFANEKFIEELLSVLNNFELALEHGKKLSQSQDSIVKSFAQGVDLTFRELTQMLSRFGVEFVGTLGESFDPAKHEALSQQACKQEQDNTIVQVLKKGCLLHGRLLAPATVIVGKFDPQSNEGQQ